MCWSWRRRRHSTPAHGTCNPCAEHGNYTQELLWTWLDATLCRPASQLRAAAFPGLRPTCKALPLTTTLRMAYAARLKPSCVWPILPSSQMGAHACNNPVCQQLKVHGMWCSRCCQNLHRWLDVAGSEGFAAASVQVRTAIKDALMNILLAAASQGHAGGLKLVALAFKSWALLSKYTIAIHANMQRTPASGSRLTCVPHLIGSCASVSSLKSLRSCMHAWVCVCSVLSSFQQPVTYAGRTAAEVIAGKSVLPRASCFRSFAVLNIAWACITKLTLSIPQLSLQKSGAVPAPNVSAFAGVSRKRNLPGLISGPLRLCRPGSRTAGAAGAHWQHCL